MDAEDALRNQLVDSLVARNVIRSPRIEAAFRAIPRHLFLPGVPIAVAYSDEAVPTKADRRRLLSSSSQPAMMAIMLAQLDLAPGMNVLEIGAGTGYNAALMAHTVGRSGHITTIDIDPDTAASAAAHLDNAGGDCVEVVCADGHDGWAPNALYDRIIATAAVETLPSAWADQLIDGGVLVAPVGGRSEQRSIAYQRMAGRLEQRSAVLCGFMALRDAAS